MHVGIPELSFKHGHVTWSVDVRGLADSPDRLWFRLPEQHAGLITELADPAVIGLLVPAMHAAEPMRVEGPVTDELVHNLVHGYQHILEAVIRGLERVGIHAPNSVVAGNPAAGVATGFSAGVDSYTVLAEHYFSTVPKDLRLTHLMFFNVGSNGSGRGEDQRRNFCIRYDRLAPVVEALGLPFVRVDSNLDDFYRFSYYQQTNGPRNIAAASLLQGGLGRYYFASSFPYAHVRIQRMHDTAFSDPISLPLLATRHFRPVSHGDQYTRVEKTLIVADLPASHGSLDVCLSPWPAGGRNCSRCFKCLRTELTLEIAGRLEQYREVFDLDVYRRYRADFLYEVVTSHDEFMIEIRDQARSAGFSLPGVRIAQARRLARKVDQKVHSLERRVHTRLAGRR